VGTGLLARSKAVAGVLNTPLIAELIRLRYKLLWANTRSRNGRIALFLVGYLLLALLIALLTTGGFAAAFVAVRAGRAEKIAQGVLLGLFLQAVLAANVLGFGMHAIFSETELRRYPLTAPDRWLSRYVIGILDPFWFLILALEFGLASGLYIMGAGAFWLGTIAVLLLFVCNYMAARVVGVFIDQLMKRKGGGMILLALVLALAIGPSLVGPFIRRNPAILPAVAERLWFTPPFGAAAAMTHSGWTAVYDLAIIVGWLLVFALILLYLEKRPPQRQAAESVKISWDSPFDRVGALFGPRIGPFVAHWLCFYGRNPRTRVMFLLSLPLFAVVTAGIGRSLGPNGLFIAALGTFPMATFLAASRIAVNQFGYVGGAFRRYFLLPTEPATTLRAASYASLTLGAAVVPVGLLAWVVFAPRPFDPRMPAMLLCSAIAGLLLFNAVGVWVTLFNPRRGNYSSVMGNDLSLGGNIVVMAGVFTSVLAPRVLYRVWPAAVSPDSWWIILPLPLIAAAVYWATLKTAGPVFAARREQILAIVEGKA
jgi:hypothetical protein